MVGMRLGHLWAAGAVGSRFLDGSGEAPFAASLQAHAVPGSGSELGRLAPASGAPDVLGEAVWSGDNIALNSTSEFSIIVTPEPGTLAPVALQLPEGAAAGAGEGVKYAEFEIERVDGSDNFAPKVQFGVSVPGFFESQHRGLFMSLRKGHLTTGDEIVRSQWASAYGRRVTVGMLLEETPRLNAAGDPTLNVYFFLNGAAQGCAYSVQRRRTFGEAAGAPLAAPQVAFIAAEPVRIRYLPQAPIPGEYRFREGPRSRKTLAGEWYVWAVSNNHVPRDYDSLDIAEEVEGGDGEWKELRSDAELAAAPTTGPRRYKVKIRFGSATTARLAADIDTGAWNFTEVGTVQSKARDPTAENSRVTITEFLQNAKSFSLTQSSAELGLRYITVHNKVNGSPVSAILREYRFGTISNVGAVVDVRLADFDAPNALRAPIGEIDFV